MKYIKKFDNLTDFDNQQADLPKTYVAAINGYNNVVYRSNDQDPSFITNIRTSQLVNDANFVAKLDADEAYAARMNIGALNGLVGSDGFMSNASGNVYALPDAASGDEDDILATKKTLKTINGASIIGSGDITIESSSTTDNLHPVATSGSYNDLTDKPTIPSAVTESTVSGWGFTKNSGTYSKPSGGIPKSDLASAVQTSLGKADTALQSYTEQYKGTVTGVKINGTTKNPSSGVVDLGTVITQHQDISGKVDKVTGKGLSTEDFTTALKTKLEGLSNYNDAEISNAVSSLQSQLNTLVSGNANDAINSFNEIIAFLDGVKDSEDLASIIASIEQQIAAKMDKVTLAKVATSGSYNDLTNKPTIPSAVTETTVSGWGFTKNTGTYSKPSGGIPKSDLASAVQTSLGKADTALQSYTEQYQGTVQSVETSETLDEVNTTTYVKYVAQTLTDAQKAQARTNIGAVAVGESTLTESDIAAMGFTKNTGTYSKPSGGIPKTDLASAVQTSLGKADTALQSYTEQYKGTITGVSANGTSVATSGVANIPAASTSAYGVTKLSSSTSSTSTTLAATASAVKSAYDLANGKQEKLVSGTNIKTINSNSILGSGNISVGTITAIQANGTSVATSGTANIPAASTSAYGVTKLSSSTSSTSTTLAATASAVKSAYDLANGKQEKLVSGTNIKTINGTSILGSGDITIEGGGSSDSSMFITHFTVDEFTSGWIDFMDEQVESIRDAARQNKIIALSTVPTASSNGYTGVLVSSYSYWEEDDLWSLHLTIIHNGASYLNAMFHHSPYFRPNRLTISSFKPLVVGIPVDEDGNATVDSTDKDNLIFIVEGECRYLSVYECGYECGTTIRFFTGEDCTIEYWGYWANGVIPTIEPYTAYEMSIVCGADFTPCAVLVQFKYAE